MKLSDLKIGEKAMIQTLEFSPEDCDRIFYLGFYPGAVIEKLRTAPMHDPLLFFLCGNEIILRRVDAANIQVEVI